MKSAPIPENEQERLASLHNLGLLDSPPEKRFDLITRLATQVFQVPISTLTLVDARREWFKSCQGLSRREGDRAISFCGHALLSADILVVPDTKKDDRFADNPMVTGKPYLRFYAGVPLLSADGQRIGVFCIKDIKPRKFSENDKEVLKGLASWAEIEVNCHDLSSAMSQEKKLRTDIEAQAQEAKRLNQLQEESKQALLNVMEDLEVTKAKVELEKVKDEAMLDSIGEGLIAVDNNRKIMVINRAAESMLGWKMKDMIGREITSLPLVDEANHLIPLDHRPTRIALETGKQIEENSYFFVRKDKTKFPIAINVTPIKSGRENIGAIVIFRDVTKEKEIDRAKSEFVSLASHQLRTPLGISKWYIEAMMGEECFRTASQTFKDYLSEVYKNNERLLTLVSDLLSISHIDQRKVKDSPQSVHLVEIVKMVIKELSILAKKYAVTLRLKLKKPKIAAIFIDQLRVEEVIENLLTNAITYSNPAGVVEITIDQQDSWISIVVKDIGIGISSKDQKQIFTKFFRAENAIAKNVEGSGLGLYVVKSYVEGWGGKIQVKSRIGKGSTFVVTLPIKMKNNKTK